MPLGIESAVVPLRQGQLLSCSPSTRDSDAPSPFHNLLLTHRVTLSRSLPLEYADRKGEVLAMTCGVIVG